MISVQTGIDLTTYTTLRIAYRKPNGIEGFWLATQDLVDLTKMYYLTLTTDLNIAGDWLLQAHISATGVDLHGDWTTLIVKTPLTN